MSARLHRETPDRTPGGGTRSPNHPGSPPMRKERGFPADLAVRFCFFLLQIVKVCFFSALVFSLAGAAAFLIVQRRIRGNEVETPNIAGLSAQQAVERLHELRLDLSIKMEGAEFSDLAPQGAIIAQVPPPGKRIKAGSAIRVRVSRGATLIPCPDVRGKNHLEAGILLREADLREGEKSFLFSPEVKKDLVIAHNPVAGSYVERKAAVDLLVSLGPATPEILMPDLTDMTVVEARDLLDSMKLEIQGVEEEPFPGKDDGLIFRQEPEAGATVAPGIGVRVTVVGNLGRATPGEAAAPLP
ncbi:MAG TPA: PASTA domain-containing protein [Sumerlaeia bacterium]|nr:PASTA domain-containing protein [Sumerlaeia bacterium]